MNAKLKAHIELLANHSEYLHPCFSEMSQREKLATYEFLREMNCDFDLEEYTKYDYMQNARFRYYLGKWAEEIGKEKEAIIHYEQALEALTQGGIDLSLKQWVKQVALKSIDDIE